MQDRGAVRVVPKRAITVVIENEGFPLAYGVVANISDHGACLWTNRRLQVGEGVSLRLSFAREPQPIEATGRVIWGEPDQEGDTLRYGLRWEEASLPGRDRLKTLIDGTA